MKKSPPARLRGRGGGGCESVKGFKNDGSLAKALSCKVEFIYSARKIVHSEEYIKKGK